MKLISRKEITSRRCLFLLHYLRLIIVGNYRDLSNRLHPDFYIFRPIEEQLLTCSHVSATSSIAIGMNNRLSYHYALFDRTVISRGIATEESQHSFSSNPKPSNGKCPKRDQRRILYSTCKRWSWPYYH